VGSQRISPPAGPAVPTVVPPGSRGVGMGLALRS
jgi:hypothetical protein